MPRRLLFDTDILIDYLRGVPQATSHLENCSGAMLVSVITVAELYAGVREGRERIALSAFLGAFHTVSLDRAIAERGGLYRRDFGKSHNTGLADALIAATATSKKALLVTLNKKHFPMLDEVLVPYTKPV